MTSAVATVERQTQPEAGIATTAPLPLHVIEIASCYRQPLRLRSRVVRESTTVTAAPAWAELDQAPAVAMAACVKAPPVPPPKQPDVGLRRLCRRRCSGRQCYSSGYLLKLTRRMSAGEARLGDGVGVPWNWRSLTALRSWGCMQGALQEQRW